MKIVSAYSGGLDTSVMIPWLSENYGGAEIIAYTGDLGQGEDLSAIREKALRTGACKAVVEDIQDRFVQEFIWPSIMASAIYEGLYPLHTALGRPLLAERLVATALPRQKTRFCPWQLNSIRLARPSSYQGGRRRPSSPSRFAIRCPHWW